MNITDAKRQKALLLHYGGEDLMVLCESLLADTDETFALAKTKLDAHFEPQVNATFETYIFRCMKQEEDETIEQYQTRLMPAAKRCDFHDVKREVRDQIVMTCLSNELRKKALRSDLGLDDLMKTARSYESSSRQADLMENSKDVHRIRNRKGPKESRTMSSRDPPRDPSNNPSTCPSKKTVKKKKKKPCFNCGEPWPHPKGKECPAKGKVCRNCMKLNHLEKVCFNKKVRHILDESSSESGDDTEDTSDYDVKAIKASVQSVDGGNINRVNTLTKIKLNGTKIVVQIDSGSDVNIITEADFNRLEDRPELLPTKMKLYPFATNRPLPILGKFSSIIEMADKIVPVIFYVIKKSKKNMENILGAATSQELGYLKVQIHVNSIEKEKSTDSTNHTVSPVIQNLIDDYSDIFQGVGKMKDVLVSLPIDENVKPITQKHRRVPFHMRKHVENEIQKLLNDDIIEKVETTPTDWVSPIVMVRKPNYTEPTYRMCVDMVQPNKALKRVRHIIPTVDELRHDYNGCTVFSKLDLNQGYFQLELDEKSRRITTFSTHIGLYRYKCLTMGAKPSAEIFHEEVRKKLAKSGVMVIKNKHDDILIGGVDEKSHLENLQTTFKICRSNNITLNLKKCEFGKSAVKFFGLIFCKEGIRPDPDKIESLRNAEPPEDKAALRSFLGMTNFSSRFIKDYSTLTFELRKLLHNDTPWEWTEREQPFETLKDQLCNDSVLNCFNVNLKSEIICDASPVGVSAMLVQYDPADMKKECPKIISYASKSLTPTEQRYSQIEREALAIHYGCIKFEMFVLGHEFTVITDHRPLVSLFNSPSKPGPFRVERLRLKLQGFQYTVRYQPGKTNPSDYLSRHPIAIQENISEDTTKEDELECHVIHSISSADSLALTLEEIERETKTDPVLSKIFHLLKEGKLNKRSLNQDPDLKPYAKISDEFSLIRNIIVRGDRVVIPKSLINRVIRLSHEGHQGIVKTKQFLRSIAWFLGMNNIIEKHVGRCKPCQASVNTPVQEPVKNTELPDHPWQKVDIDFLGPLPSGDYILVVIDEYTRFPEVFITKSTSLKPTIANLDKLFSSYGIPEEVKSDNGPPFKSRGFKQFSRRLGFKHRRITPRHPKANGLVENFNRMIIKILKIARMECLPWRDELRTFLLNYRATIHLSTGKSPAELFFGKRPFKTRLGFSSLSKLKDGVVCVLDRNGKI